MRTKIIATVGPKSNSLKILREMARAGVNIFRSNLSHGSREFHSEKIAQIVELKKEFPNLQILLDTRGPEIRLGKFDGEFEISADEKFTLSAAGEFNFSQKVFPVNFDKFHENVFVGEKVAIDGGFLRAEVCEIENKNVVCRAENFWKVRAGRHINLPGARVNLPTIPDSDRADLEFFSKNAAVDFFALSFLRTADDLKTARKFSGEKKLIAKIENAEGVKNLSKILAAADGVMVARGDLGVEISLAKVPKVQREILRAANDAGKFSIVATEMLESMCEKPRPTRAEISDVATAVWERAGAVMLSDETTVGNFPVESVKMMAEIVAANEE